MAFAWGRLNVDLSNNWWELRFLHIITVFILEKAFKSLTNSSNLTGDVTWEMKE